MISTHFLVSCLGVHCEYSQGTGAPAVSANPGPCPLCLTPPLLQHGARTWEGAISNYVRTII